jgi:peptidoglycan/LPS O-acetylase OafA/YrhL
MHDNNFNSLRLIAAYLVFYSHSFLLKPIPKPETPYFLGLFDFGIIGVYIFFCISGYLVSKSWDNDQNIRRFLIKRILRIFPGLIIVILLCTFILGPIFTNLSIKSYFNSQLTWKYLTNIFLFRAYNLPGVFETNFHPYTINGSLWSLKVEFIMYIMLPFLSLLTKNIYYNIFIAFTFILLNINGEIIFNKFLINYERSLLEFPKCASYFWIGVCINRFKLEKYFTISNLCLLMFFILVGSNYHVLLPLIVILYISVISISFGSAKSIILIKITKNDYSYGIYIYSFPVQQTISSISPNISFINYLIITSLITLLFSIFSWHFIEKPMLKLKHKIACKNRGCIDLQGKKS